MHMRCCYIRSFRQLFDFPIISVSLVPDAFSSARPQNTHVHTCTRVHYQHATTDCENLSLSSHRAKDGGQGEVSGCPHHLVVIKAHCMLGRIVKLPTETLDMYMCVFWFCKETHIHTHTVAPQGEFHSPWVNMSFTVFSVSLVPNTFTDLQFDVYTVCSPSWRLQDHLRDQLVFWSCAARHSVWLYEPDITVLCHVIYYVFVCVLYEFK